MHMKPIRRFSVPGAMALLLAVVFSGPALAQGSERAERLQARLAERFAAADQDRDGRLTRAEAEAGMPFVHRNFEQIDSAGQGSLSQDDILAWMATQAAARRR
jgi:Ca2+-binding EF-hand superfamily protein